MSPVVSVMVVLDVVEEGEVGPIAGRGGVEVMGMGF